MGALHGNHKKFALVNAQGVVGFTVANRVPGHEQTDGLRVADTLGKHFTFVRQGNTALPGRIGFFPEPVTGNTQFFTFGVAGGVVFKLITGFDAGVIVVHVFQRNPVVQTGGLLGFRDVYFTGNRVSTGVHPGALPAATYPGAGVRAGSPTHVKYVSG